MGDNTSELGVRVLEQAFKETADETISSVGASALAAVMHTAIANPVASALGTIAKVLIGEMFKQTSAIERKIDRILEEPLQTAVTTVQDVISVDATTTAELREVDRQLHHAFDRLREAYTYAAKQTPEKRTCVLLYQAIVASLMRGGRPFAEQYLNELQSLSSKLRSDACEATAHANSIRQIDTSNEAILEREIRWSLRPDGLEQKTAFWSVASARESEKKHLRERARHMHTQADSVDLFCNYIASLLEHRLERRDDLLGLQNDDRKHE